MPECKVMKISCLIIGLLRGFPDIGFYLFYMEVILLKVKKMPVKKINRHYYKN